MTREDAIAHGKEQLEIFGGEHREFIELAIQALEKEEMANEIIAEHEKEQERIERDFNRNRQTMCFATAKNIHDTQLSNLVANQALEQTSEDCISRESAIHCITETELDLGVFADAKMRIEELPSIQPKNGEWTKDYHGYFCSNCNAGFGIPFNYCPNCGAQMNKADKE